MNLQGLLNSRRSGALAFRLSRNLNPGIGYRLADLIAAWISSKKDLPMVQAIRSNQWVVSGQKADVGELDRLVKASIQNIGYSFYTLFHYQSNIEKTLKFINFSSKAKDVIEESQKDHKGLIILGVHMCGFDLVLQTAGHIGLKALALSLENPNEAVEWQHKFRRESGIEILPSSMSTIKLAIKRLREGHTVLTGVDRPIPNPKYKPNFFGLPASIPVHYVQLAVRAQVPVVVMAAIQRADRTYDVLASDKIVLNSHPDRQTEMLRNAERVLEIAEDYILKDPQQWAVIHPVWPEKVGETPLL